jgi:D-alanyl-lipoteichoic acid acyltransferase DltB (MBOAT superfamily)
MAAITSYELNLLAIFLAALIFFAFPKIQNRSARLVVGLLVAIVVYRAAIATFAVVSLVTWLTAVIIERISSSATAPRKLRWNLSAAAIIVIVALFVGADAYWFRRWHGTVFSLQWALLLPDMWLLLRLISYLWEFGAGRVGGLDFGAYGCWLVFPFTLHGPFLRYSNFAAQERKVESSQKNSQFEWRTIALGAAALVIGLALERAELGLRAVDAHWSKALIVFLTGPWGFYLETTGLFHLMEGTATTWGFTLPRSFHRPFGSRNLSEFWQAWNIPVTDFFRDALFYQRWGLKKANPYFNVLLVFVAVGVWHGRNLYWTTWGALHGVGFCVFMAWKTWRGHTTKQPSTISRWVSAAITYVFVCSCWYLPNKIVPLIHRYLF